MFVLKVSCGRDNHYVSRKMTRQFAAGGNSFRSCFAAANVFFFYYFVSSTVLYIIVTIQTYNFLYGMNLGKSFTLSRKTSKTR